MVGGLVGDNLEGSITMCYSTGVVTGNDYVGGLVGDFWPSWLFVDETSSFWDLETSGHMTSALGTGKTTVEMQIATTFLEAGWDFMDETVNGDEDLWWIDEGNDYPKLWWEDSD
jgi:hypothetical protein